MQDNLNKKTEKKKTIDLFLFWMKTDYSRFSDVQIKEAIDRIAFWTKDATDDDQFIVHLYLYWLSIEFNFEIDV